MRRGEHRCKGDGCGYCEAQIARAEDARDDRSTGMTEREWDAWEAGPGWNNVDLLRGA